MADLQNPRLIYSKGILFLLSGLLAGSILIMEHPDLRSTVLLMVTVWCFCRFYYFSFYVIEHYVDGNYKFAGLWDFAKYCASKRRQNS